MSDAPDRRIQGLTPRAGKPAPLGRLVKAQRDAGLTVPDSVVEPSATFEPTTPLQIAPEAAQAAPEPATRRASKPSTTKRRAKKPASVGEEGKRSMSVYVPASVQERAKAAYKRTHVDEDETSWSEFVEHAIVAETKRREEIYNGGQPFAGDSRLPTGRPLRP